MQELLQAAAKREQARVAADILDTQVKIVTASYNSAAAYTNLILLGGYAGFFGLWQLTKDYLSKDQALWSALLILVSLLSFILFEVIKMILLTRSIMQKAKMLQSAEAKSSPERALAALKELESSLDHSMGPFMRFWAVTVGICVATALAGAGILGYAFVTGLAR